RAMALAFLPVPLLVIYTLPKAHYFLSEQLIFLAAFWAGVLMALDWVARKVPVLRKNGIAPVLAVVSCAGVLVGSPMLKEAHLRRPIHEMEIARAASRQIVGPNARVASRHLAWYVSGGAEWYRVESDLTEPTKLENFDPKRYASQFDAVAEY